MTNYTKSTNFASKDSLASGNALKIVKGTEIDAEFNNLATAVATKADSLSPTFTGTPAAPTAAVGTSTTQLATTAFVLSNTSPTGHMLMWPTATAPTGFLMCAGTAVSRSTYAALFAVIGTLYGAGDGSTTFNLPNFVNRSPIGAGSLYAANTQVGSKDAVVVSHTHTFTGNALAPHAHTVVANTPNIYDGAGGGNNFLGFAQTLTTSSVSGGTPSGTVNAAPEQVAGTDKNLHPVLGIYFIIKT